MLTFFRLPLVRRTALGAGLVLTILLTGALPARANAELRKGLAFAPTLGVVTHGMIARAQILRIRRSLRSMVRAT
jgi:hypothetical protein